jgi:hypothetical protein
MTTPGRATTESHGRITVSVNGEDLGMFDTMSEPSSTADVETRAPAGSTVRRAAFGGPREDDAVTVTREFVPERDHALVRRLRPVLTFADAVVREQPLDGRRLPFGTPSVYAGGILSNVATSGYDTDSASPRFLTLVVTGGVWQ